MLCSTFVAISTIPIVIFVKSLLILERAKRSLSNFYIIGQSGMPSTVLQLRQDICISDLQFLKIDIQNFVIILSISAYNNCTKAFVMLHCYLHCWTPFTSCQDSNELLESGDETFFPALNVGPEKSSTMVHPFMHIFLSFRFPSPPPSPFSSFLQLRGVWIYRISNEQ